MKKKPRIIVVGSANVDLTSFTDHFPRPGETVFGDDFDLGFGGKGANQAVAAKLCGADVDMVARVGDDLFGPATIKNLSSQGIGTKHVKIVKGVSTGVAPIFVDSRGQNRIVVVKGANDKLTARGISAATSLLRRADMIVLQFEIPMETNYHVARFARKHGIPCILNPAPASTFDLSRFIGVDYFIPNETEAESIAGNPVQTEAQARDCAAFLLDRGFRRIIITLGERGALFADGTDMELVASYPVKARDTTGAGDAFIGSFAVFLAEGLPARQALARANLYAALSTLSIGTQKSLVTRARFNREWKARA